MAAKPSKTSPRQALSAAFSTPVPPNKQARYRQKKAAEPSPILDMLLQEGVPSTLAAQLSDQCLTKAAVQRALQHWTGRCHLTGLALAESPAMLQPVQRPDGRFVCRAARELQGDLGDLMLTHLCELVVQTAAWQQVPHTGQPTAPAPQPAPAHQPKDADHAHRPDQAPHLELQRPDSRAEDEVWPLDGSSPTGPGDSERGRLDDPVDEWLRRYEGETVLAG
ncbi:MAG: hypothetical protein RL260_2710 [Pseudomonadota bacterium]